MGQSIYRYLKSQSTIEIKGWLDKNYTVCRKMNMEVNAPDYIEELQDEAYDLILITVNNQRAVMSIRQYLETLGVKREKIKWLDEEFIKEDYFIIDKLF